MSIIYLIIPLSPSVILNFIWGGRRGGGMESKLRHQLQFYISPSCNFRCACQEEWKNTSYVFVKKEEEYGNTYPSLKAERRLSFSQPGKKTARAAES